jgi:hypothetical protein
MGCIHLSWALLLPNLLPAWCLNCDPLVLRFNGLPGGKYKHIWPRDISDGVHVDSSQPTTCSQRRSDALG